jgi:Matrixin
MKLGYLIVCIALTGCAEKYGNDYTVYVSPAFPADEQVLFFKAAQQWVAMVPAWAINVRFGIADCDKNDQANTICIKAATQQWIDNRENNPSCLAFTTISHSYLNFPGSRNKFDNSSDIYFPDNDDWKTNAFFEQVAAHELGHGFGLVHTGAGTLMCKDTGCAALTVTCADKDQYLGVRDYFDTPCN